MTEGRIIEWSTLKEGEPVGEVRYAVEFRGPVRWSRYPVQTFSTWEGAAGWLAAQGVELVD